MVAKSSAQRGRLMAPPVFLWQLTHLPEDAWVELVTGKIILTQPVGSGSELRKPRLTRIGNHRGISVKCIPNRCWCGQSRRFCRMVACGELDQNRLRQKNNPNWTSGG